MVLPVVDTRCRTLSKERITFSPISAHGGGREAFHCYHKSHIMVSSVAMLAVCPIWRENDWVKSTSHIFYSQILHTL